MLTTCINAHAQYQLWEWRMSTAQRRGHLPSTPQGHQRSKAPTWLQDQTFFLSRLSYQDRKYDIQADAQRGSIDLAQAGAGESALVQLKSALSTALLPCCKGSDDGKDSIAERLHTFTLKNVLFLGLCCLHFSSNRSHFAIVSCF